MKLSLKKEGYDKYSKALVPYLKNTENQKYISVFLTIGASIFFILFAINPTISTIARLTKEVADNKTLENNLSKKIENINSLGSLFPDIEQDIPLIEDAVPIRPDAPTLVAQIQKLADESAITIGSVEVSPINLTANQGTSSSTFDFSMTIGGQYNDFSRFLDYLVTMQRALSINSILITKIQSEGRLVSGVLKGTAYFKK